MTEAEDLLAGQLDATGTTGYVRQAKFSPDRKFRADFAFPEHGLLIEVQGGGYVAGRHTRGAGYAADCARMGLALALGWRMLYVTTQQVSSGEALEMVQSALRAPERPELPAVAPTRPKRRRATAQAIAQPASATETGGKAREAPLRIDPDDAREVEIHQIIHELGFTRARAEAIVAHNARRGGVSMARHDRLLQVELKEAMEVR